MPRALRRALATVGGRKARRRLPTNCQRLFTAHLLPSLIEPRIQRESRPWLQGMTWKVDWVPFLVGRRRETGPNSAPKSETRRERKKTNERTKDRECFCPTLAARNSESAAVAAPQTITASRLNVAGRELSLQVASRPARCDNIGSSSWKGSLKIRCTPPCFQTSRGGKGSGSFMFWFVAKWPLQCPSRPQW